MVLTGNKIEAMNNKSGWDGQALMLLEVLRWPMKHEREVQKNGEGKERILTAVLLLK